MRAERLARVAAKAEVLRLKRIVRAQIVRAVLAMVAVLFALFGLVAVHLAAGIAIARSLGGVGASLIVFGADVVIALILVWAASRTPRDRLAYEAKEVRDRALGELRQTATLASIALTLSRMIGRADRARPITSLLRRLFGRRGAA
jgi:hypothetical protein